MTVAITLKDGQATFAERGILIDVPEGSELLPLRGFCPRFGTLLFVPSGARTRRGWSAADVVRAATSRRGRFRIV